MSKIELLLRSRLLKDTFSLMLTEAGFFVFHEQSHHDNDTIVVLDSEACKDREFVRTLQSRGVKIVVLTSDAVSRELEPEEIASLSGVLTYDFTAAAFVRSLRLISSGERVFPRDLAVGQRQQACPPGTELRSSGVHLSPREIEILSHLVVGHSNKVIGRHLDITEATVKVHLKSVLRKISVENRTQAAIWAMSNLPELDIPLAALSDRQPSARPIA